jgi:hypothetical protein
MNAHRGRSSHRLQTTALTTLLLLSSSAVAEESPAKVAKGADSKPSPAAPATLAEGKAPVAPLPERPVLLVRPSTVPLGDNSVIAVSPQEAREELKGIENGLFRPALAGPKVLSVPEQGGWVRGFFKEPKASKLWSFFNPKAPLDSGTDLMRSARIFGIRGDAPLPTSMQDPIQVEPVGVRFWQIDK